MIRRGNEIIVNYRMEESLKRETAGDDLCKNELEISEYEKIMQRELQYLIESVRKERN